MTLRAFFELSLRPLVFHHISPPLLAWLLQSTGICLYTPALPTGDISVSIIHSQSYSKYKSNTKSTTRREGANSAHSLELHIPEFILKVNGIIYWRAGTHSREGEGALRHGKEASNPDARTLQSIHQERGQSWTRTGVTKRRTRTTAAKPGKTRTTSANGGPNKERQTRAARRLILRGDVRGV